MIEAIFGTTTQVLEKSMSLRMLRQGLLASNIANAETPNYRPVDIDFRATMEQLVEKARTESPLELRRTDPRHFTIREARGANEQRLVFVANDDVSITDDNNSVNLEAELARLQANAALFSVTTQLLKKKLAGIADIIERSSRL